MTANRPRSTRPATPHRLLVVEILDRGHVAREREPLPVERRRRVELPGVADRHRAPIASRVPPGRARGWIVQEEAGPLGHRREVADRGLDHASAPLPATALEAVRSVPLRRARASRTEPALGPEVPLAPNLVP